MANGSLQINDDLKLWFFWLSQELFIDSRYAVK